MEPHGQSPWSSAQADKKTRKEAVLSSLRVSLASKEGLFATRFDSFIYFCHLNVKKNRPFVVSL
jgi:hypothetical protein